MKTKEIAIDPQAAAFKARMDLALAKAIEKVGEDRWNKLIESLREDMEAVNNQKFPLTKYNYGVWMSLLGSGDQAYNKALYFYAAGGDINGIYWAGKVNGLWD